MVLKFTLQHAICEKKYIASFLLLFFMTSFAVHAQQCDASLIVENNVDSRSADETDGTGFPLLLKNTSSSKQNFTLSTSFLNEGCDSSNTRQSNVEVGVNFSNANGSRNSISSIELAPNESYKVMALVEVPKGTTFNRWSCFEVQVKSASCSSIIDKITLKIFVTNPSVD